MEFIETSESRDIAPSPRILRMLGEIPFAPWQCIAELVDNALDIARKENHDVLSDEKKQVVVSWSSESVAAADRQLEVVDNGQGMSLDAIQDNVRAGYSNNDPFNNLGLFGMGFNIATSRLGEKAVFISATADSPEYVGIEIDFERLIKSNSFDAPVVRFPKARANEHGTKVIVQKLKPNMYSKLKNSATQIRDILADLYAPILQSGDVEVRVQSKVISPRLHCTWSPSRYVTVSRNSLNIPARINVDELLGESLFDINKNRYLSAEEEEIALREQLLNGSLPKGIVTRAKRVHGWLGIQRYPDTNDFGIDFIRNGRKILRRDKQLFYYENELTGTQELEYPVELGATVGGRIVGEIHVDHVPPNYQKNDFDRSDPSWHEVVELLRGVGPIRPNARKALGFSGDNLSPLGKLVKGYGIVDKGTKHLVAYPHDTARQWANLFRQGDPEYQSDEKWFESAREADRLNAEKLKAKPNKADPGPTASDDTSSYLTLGDTPGGDNESKEDENKSIQPPSLLSITTSKPVSAADLVEDLKQRSVQVSSASGEYNYPGSKSPLKVYTWEVITGKIGEGEEGEPCLFNKDGMQVDFFYNPRHPFLRDYPFTFQDLLLMGLAERFKMRDDLNIDIPLLFSGMVVENVPGIKLDLGVMQETANTFFSRLREFAPEILSLREQEVIDYVHDAVGEVEEIANALLSNTELLRKFQTRSTGAINSLSVAPAKTIVRLVEHFPEEFFDGKFFKMPYSEIQLPDPRSTERLRTESKDRLLSFLKDALWVISESRSNSKQQRAELARCAQSLNILKQEIEL